MTCTRVLMQHVLPALRSFKHRADDAGVHPGVWRGLSVSPLLTQAALQQLQDHVVAQLQEVLAEAFPKGPHRNLYGETSWCLAINSMSAVRGCDACYSCNVPGTWMSAWISFTVVSRSDSASGVVLASTRSFLTGSQRL